jgi:hypothetical protein
MKHDELLNYINDKLEPWDRMFNIADHDDFPEYTRKQAINGIMPWVALYQVVEIHKPKQHEAVGYEYCDVCTIDVNLAIPYPCHTIHVIEATIDGLDVKVK